jgi:hypothetical protein
MSNGHFHIPTPVNETVLQFAPKSAEKIALKKVRLLFRKH